MLSLSLAAAATLPTFPQDWSVHEDQLAKVAGSVYKWHGMVFNDQANISRPFCKPPTSSVERNCSATAYVDDSGHKSTYDFFEPNQSMRGLTYFVQAGYQPCYCDMDVLGSWLQCEIAESLCNPNMLKRGTMSEASFDGEPVDAIEWSETLLVASTHYRIYVHQNTSSPVQYYTTFFEGTASLGFNEVNMSAFTPGRPDPSVFDVPGSPSGVCADNVCLSYAARRKEGLHPIVAFEGWQHGWQ